MNSGDGLRDPEQTSARFVGRTHELTEIAAFLQCGQSVSIVGPPQSGKTALLLHLMRSTTRPDLGLAGDNLFVYLDCEAIGAAMTTAIFGRFLTGIAAALADRSLPMEPMLETASAQPTRLAFEVAVRKLNQSGLRLVLILDAFDRLSGNPHLDVSFYNVLRSIAGRYQLVFLTASVRPLIELTYASHPEAIASSPFFNIFASCFLESEIVKNPGSHAVSG